MFNFIICFDKTNKNGPVNQSSSKNGGKVKKLILIGVSC